MNWSPEYPLLTTTEVAGALRVSKRTVCLWAECGDLPALRIGKQWRFRRKEFFDWLERSGITNSDKKEYIQTAARVGLTVPKARAPFRTGISIRLQNSGKLRS